MNNEPMTSERLDYIQQGIESGAYEGYVARSTIAELFAEVKRLRSNTVIEPSVLMRNIETLQLDERMRTIEQHVQEITAEDTRLRTENLFLQTRCDTLELARDSWNRTATEYKNEFFAAKKRLTEAQALADAVVAIDAAAEQRDKAAEEFGSDDDETFQRDLEFGGVVARAIEQARAFLEARDDQTHD